jgi:hypothetical protein
MLNEEIDTKKSQLKKEEKNIKSIELTHRNCGPNHGYEITL